MFLIRNVQTGCYVARKGHHSSYTTSVKLARKFRFESEAEADLCPENERVVDAFEALGFRDLVR